MVVDEADQETLVQIHDYMKTELGKANSENPGAEQLLPPA